MNAIRSSYTLVGLMLIVLFLVACGASAPPPNLKAGHWEGEPSVSFDVTANGDIRDFKIVAPFGVLASQMGGLFILRHVGPKLVYLPLVLYNVP